MSGTGVPRRQTFLDTYRGYALLAITLNHFAIVGHDEGLVAAHSFTLTPVGLSSAAEIFVMCSGYAFALAYGRLLNRAGFAVTWKKAARRSVLLMVCNLLMTVASATIIMSFIPIPYHQTGSFQMADDVFADFAVVLRKMVSLQWTPAYHDVLPLYALLLLVAPLQLYGLHRAPKLTVAISAGLWLLAVTNTVTPADLGLPSWYFHPLAWQFLFFLGMFASRINALDRLPTGKRVIMLYVVLLFSAFGFKLAAHGGMVPMYLRIGMGHGAVPLDDKLTLGPLRILHALLLAACMAAIYKQIGEAGRRPLERWLGRIGRSSLPVFVVSNPLMFLAAGLLAVAPTAGLFYALSVVLALSLLCFAIVWQRRLTRQPAVFQQPRRDYIGGD